MKETSAGAIIYRTDEATRKPKYLLLHYGSGHWDFVKGHIEGKETEEETLRREAKEESGLADLKIIKGFRRKISYFYRKDGETIPKDVIFFLAQTTAAEKDVKLSFEHSGYDWLGFDKAVKKTTYGSSKDVLKKAHKFLEENVKNHRSKTGGILSTLGRYASAQVGSCRNSTRGRMRNRACPDLLLPMLF